jgi:hypothetical protein
MSSSNDEEIDWQVVKTLIFGEGIHESVFERWLQPFQFFKDEPTALIQESGGPCAVLAPIQAYIIKKCLHDKIHNVKDLSRETVKKLLLGALCEILSRCRNPDSVITLARISPEVASVWQDSLQCNSSKRMRCDNVDVETFHTCLSLETFQTVTNLTKFLEDNDVFGNKYDIVCFLYSVILTKGPARIIDERQDMDESLIDPVHGHGSQSLINLLITGHATQNVFDGVRDLCGMDLTGISEQSEVGFLSYLECLRYLEVGENLKSPKYPVWLLGSETHLTLLWSQDMRLVKPKSARELAIMAFNEIDKDHAGFIPVDELKNLLDKLELFAEEEYVKIMLEKVDPDCLGIVLLPLFLEEFFPESGESIPDTFTLYHYNGLRKSNSAGKFIKGNAILLEGVHGKADGNQMLQTLQTKWPSIAIDWDTMPSIN